MEAKPHTRAVAIIQARMGSSRLPGKVMLPLAGRPTVFHIWERLSQCRNLDQIVVATTSSSEDRPLVDYCQKEGIEVFPFTGAIDDLLGRYIACGEKYGAEIVVMVCGDCPLLHPPTIERMVQAMREDPVAEYCGINGDSIEGGVAVLTLAAYRKMEAMATENTHREHAVLVMMEHPELFAGTSVDCEQGFSGIKHRLWLDTPADYRFLSEVYRRLYQPGEIVDLHRVVGMIRTDEELRNLNRHVTQKGVYEEGALLVADVSNLPRDHIPEARIFIHRLVEVYRTAVRLCFPAVTGTGQALWDEHLIPSSQETARPTETEIDLVAGSDFLPLAPAYAGKVRLRIGLEPGTGVIAADTLACYLGLEKDRAGHFVLDRVISKGGLEEPPCPLCGSLHVERMSPFPNGVSPGICADCGHVYLARCPAEGVADYRAYRQHYPSDFLRDRSNAFFTVAAARKALIERVLPAAPRHLLEIGSGYGHFLSLWDGLACRVGIEPSREQTAFARAELGVRDLWNCGWERFEQDSAPAGRPGFDLVCAFHVLEHMRQPGAFIAFARKVLAPGGYLVLSVPNLFTLQPDLMELYYLASGMHLHSFYPSSLALLLARGGFRVCEQVEDAPHPLHPSSFTLVAQKDDAVTPELSAADIGEARLALQGFQRELAQRLDRITAAFSRWEREGRKVALYGAGLHSCSLLELSGVRPDQLCCLVDDDLGKQGSKLHGLTVVGLQEALSLGVEVVVASSLAAEEAMLARLRIHAPAELTLVGIYRDICASEQGA